MPSLKAVPLLSHLMGPASPYMNTLTALWRPYNWGDETGVPTANGATSLVATGSLPDHGQSYGSAAKGLAIGLEVAGSGLVGCRYFHSLLFLTMCSSLPACLSLVTMVCRPPSLL